MPKFSVVTICYNDAVGLASTIRSVGSQTCSDFEYIIQDGCSTDVTKDIVLGFRDWIDIFNSEPDEGIYDAMNKSVASASGDYLLFLNAADVFADCDTLEKIDQMMMEADEIVHGEAIDLDSGKIHPYKPLNDFAFGMVLDHQAAIVKTELLRRYPFDTTFKVAGDLDFFSRCRKEGVRFRQIDLAIPKKPFSVGVSSDYLTRFKERSRVLLKYFAATYPDIGSRLKTELLQYVQETFGSESLSKRLQDEELSEILKNIDDISHQLRDALDCRNQNPMKSLQPTS